MTLCSAAATTSPTPLISDSNFKMKRSCQLISKPKSEDVKAKRARKQPMTDAYRTTLKTLAQISDGCRSYIVKTLKEALKELDNVYTTREWVIEECMTHLDVYINMVKLCEEMTDIFDLGFDIQIDTRDVDKGCYGLIAPIHDRLTEYYLVSESHVLDAPHPWPKNNLKLRLYLKRLSELPYFLHRDMATVIQRFINKYPKVKVNGLRSILDCFVNLMDDFCGFHWSDMNTFDRHVADMSRNLSVLSNHSGSKGRPSLGKEGSSSKKRKIYANDELFQKVQASLPAGHVLL